MGKVMRLRGKVLVSCFGVLAAAGLIGIGLLIPAGGSCSVAGGQAVVPYFQGLGDLPGGEYYSNAWDVSKDGTAVTGHSRVDTDHLAFRWTEATGMVLLPDFPGGIAMGDGDGITFDGSIVAGHGNSDLATEACIWTLINGQWVPQGLGDLPGGDFNSFAYHITPDGKVVVGDGSSNKGYAAEACRWSFNGTVWIPEALGDLSGGDYWSQARGCSDDGSVVVGRSRTKEGIRAFRWTAAKGMVNLGVLSKRKWSVAWGCSADGSVVVGQSWGPGTSKEEAFRWTAATGMKGLGELPGGIFFSEADGVSADGSIVVGGSASANGNEAFIWDAANGMRRAADYLAGKGLALPPGWVLRFANSITIYNGMVTIVGNGTNPDGNTEAWIAVVVQ